MIRLLGKTNVIALIILILGVFMTFVNIYQLRSMQREYMSLSHPELSSDAVTTKPKYAVYGKNIDSGYLKHVYNVLHRAGYVRTSYNTSSDWSVLWSHDYPFTKIRPVIMKMNKYQKVNKLPGSGYVTNKVNLATSGFANIPKAFKIPDESEKLKAYARENPEKLFVQKNKNHRGIKIEKIDKIDLSKDGSFVQEFVDDPLLIDGYKFDIGIYTMITSIDPLRIYVFEGDALLRFCPEKYHPFDVENRNKYVVHDDYRPTWEVPTMAKIYSDMGYSFRETLNTHIRSLGKDPDDVWGQMYDVIRNVYTLKEPLFRKALSNYPHKRAFFEMVRFDFVLDSKLQAYLMEANMSPNLSSKHFSSNRLLYEQALYSLLRLTGIVRGGISSPNLQPVTKEALEMQIAEKDLHVFPDECISERCSRTTACEDNHCHLCRHCLSSEELGYLTPAFLEHTNRHMCRRVFPRPVLREEAKKWKDKVHGENVTSANIKMEQWFAGKCLMDRNWCD